MTPEKEKALFEKLDSIEFNISKNDIQIATFIEVFRELNVNNRFKHLEDKVTNLENRLILLEREAR